MTQRLIDTCFWLGAAVVVLVAMLVALSLPAYGATLTTRSGTLATAQAATGASANLVDCTPGMSGIVFNIAATGTATVIVEHANDGTTWAPLTVQGVAITTGSLVGASSALSIAPCIGQYRLNATTCTGCAMTGTYIRSDAP